MVRFITCRKKKRKLDGSKDSKVYFDTDVQGESPSEVFSTNSPPDKEGTARYNSSKVLIGAAAAKAASGKNTYNHSKPRGGLGLEMTAVQRLDDEELTTNEVVNPLSVVSTGRKKEATKK